jgi:methylamine---glutamate N-methyltransferase subunit A
MDSREVGIEEKFRVNAIFVASHATFVNLLFRSDRIPRSGPEKKTMCGIAGLFLKNRSLEADLGRHFSGMLECLSSRGPDSAGFAIYGESAPSGEMKYTLHHPNPAFTWGDVAAAIGALAGRPPEWSQISTHAVFTTGAGEAKIAALLHQKFPEVKMMSAGERIEIMKEVGLPGDILKRFHVREMSGTHAIGHTRMATESAVTTSGSHPFSTGPDLCLVHNGSLSNHNALRRNLRREGIEFETDNDSEVAAGYLTSRLRRGEDLKTALEHALDDLDGFFTFTVGTKDGFAVLRDRVACKPAVMAETGDYVAMASEYRSLVSLPGIESARLWEPEPGVVYSWSIGDAS